MKPIKIIVSGLLAVYCLTVGQLLVAQDNVGDDSTVRYPASYFAQWNPRTAQDMLDRIPGLSVGGGFGPSGGGGGGFGGGPPPGFFGRGGGGGGGRGFGGGNRGSEILINGKRTAGKNNSTGGQLSRITADQVNFIEIIRGTSGELDVRGSGQVVNLVLYETFTDSSLQYQIQAQQSDNNNIAPNGTLSYSGQIGGLSYLFSGSHSENYSKRISKEDSILADFSPNDDIREERETDGSSTAFSTNLDYEINERSSARINALFSEGDSPSELVRRTIDLKVQPNTTAFQRELAPSENDNWEVGGDYEYLTDSGSRYKLLFISNSFTNSITRERFDLLGEQQEEKTYFLILVVQPGKESFVDLTHLICFPDHKILRSVRNVRKQF